VWERDASRRGADRRIGSECGARDFEGTEEV